MGRNILFVLLIISVFIMSCVLINTPQVERSIPNPTFVVLQSQDTVDIETEEAVQATEISTTHTSEHEISKNISTDEPESFPYEAQPGTPTQTTSWLYGCDWYGIGGQVIKNRVDLLSNFVIEAGGSINDQEIFGLSLVGLASDYGPGGYEIKLSNQPVESSDSIWIQLKNIEGVNLSRKIFISTSGGCTENLILVNFTERGEPQVSKAYLPIIIH